MFDGSVAEARKLIDVLLPAHFAYVGSVTKTKAGHPVNGSPYAKTHSSGLAELAKGMASNTKDKSPNWASTFACASPD